jgi:hypothetical protein
MTMSNVATTTIGLKGAPAEVDRAHAFLAASGASHGTPWYPTALGNPQLVCDPEITRPSDTEITLRITMNWQLDAIAEADMLAERFPALRVTALVCRESEDPEYEVALWLNGQLVSGGWTEGSFEICVPSDDRKLHSALLFQRYKASIDAFRAVNGSEWLPSIVARLEPRADGWRVNPFPDYTPVAWRDTPLGGLAVFDTRGFSDDAKPFAILEGICPAGSYTKHALVDHAALVARFPELAGYFPATAPKARISVAPAAIEDIF